MSAKRTKGTDGETERRCPPWFVVVYDLHGNKWSTYRCSLLPDDPMGRYVRDINSDRNREREIWVEFVLLTIGHVEWEQFNEECVDVLESVDDIPELFSMPNCSGGGRGIPDDDWDWVKLAAERCVPRWEKVDRIDGSVEGVSFVSR